IAVAAERSLSLLHDIEDAVNQQTAESHRLVAVLSEVAGGSRETLESAASVEDAAAALDALAGSLEDEARRFRMTSAAGKPALATAFES
ncbi:MAG: hypothetical protein JNK60_20615, partial [Acidobacteria bacterium]|nr:hypothetical protein [Acidobacteriota bacterium]